jgi:hypothetical protein
MCEFSAKMPENGFIIIISCWNCSKAENWNWEFKKIIFDWNKLESNDEKINENILGLIKAR